MVQGGGSTISGAVLRQVHGSELGLNNERDWEDPDVSKAMSNLWTVVQAVIFENKKLQQKENMHLEVQSLQDAKDYYAVNGKVPDWVIQIDIGTQSQTPLGELEITFSRLTAMLAPCLRIWLQTDPSGINVLNAQGLNFMTNAELKEKIGDAVNLVCMLRGGSMGFDWNQYHSDLKFKLIPSFVFAALFKTQFLALMRKGELSEESARSEAIKQYTKTTKLHTIRGVAAVDRDQCIEFSQLVTSADPNLTEAANDMIDQFIKDGAYVNDLNKRIRR